MTVPPPEGQPSAETHAQTIREEIGRAARRSRDFGPRFHRALTALDSLLALVATLTQERDEWKATAEVLEDESVMVDLYASEKERADAAEREAATLREALAEIAEAPLGHFAHSRCVTYGVKDHARAALAAAAPTDEPGQM